MSIRQKSTLQVGKGVRGTFDSEFCIPTTRETRKHFVGGKKEQSTARASVDRKRWGRSRDPHNLEKAPSCDWPSGEMDRGTDNYAEYRHVGDMYVQSFLGFPVKALWGLRLTADSLTFPPIDQRVLVTGCAARQVRHSCAFSVSLKRIERVTDSESWEV